MRNQSTGRIIYYEYRECGVEWERINEMSARLVDNADEQLTEQSGSGYILC